MKMKDREEFVRKISKRVNNAIQAIKEVEKLANRSVYDYTQKDMDMIIDALTHEVETCRNIYKLSLRVDSWVEFSLEGDSGPPPEEEPEEDPKT